MFAAFLGASVFSGCGSGDVDVDTAPIEIQGKPIDSIPAPETSAISEPAKPVPADAATNEVSVALTPPAPAPAAGSPVEVEASDADGFLHVGFDRLAGFTYEMPEDLQLTEEAAAAIRSAGRIPEPVRSLNAKRIALKGFMLPLKVQGGLVTELLIMRDQSMCCFGTVPKINEWVSVKMSEKGVKPVMDEPVTLYGTLRVGEMLENGYLVGIYELDGEKMARAADL